MYRANEEEYILWSLHKKLVYAMAVNDLECFSNEPDKAFVSSYGSVFSLKPRQLTNVGETERVETHEDRSETIARGAQIEADAELAARMEQEDIANKNEGDELTKGDQVSLIVESSKRILNDYFPSNTQALSSRYPLKAIAETQFLATAKRISIVSKRAKRATKIFKRNDDEKEEWIALMSNYTYRIVMYLIQKNAIPRLKGGSKLKLVEQLFKHLETLPTKIELDEIRETL